MDFRRRISRQRSSRVEDVVVPQTSRHRRQRSGWSSIPKWPAWAQVALVLGLTGLLWFVKWMFTVRDNNWQDVNFWLKSNGLQEHHKVFWKSGVVSLEEAADLDVNAAPAFSNLDSSSRESMQKKINVLKEELILKYFLEEEHLLKYHDRLLMHDIGSLEALANIDENTMQKVTAIDRSMKDYGRLKNRVSGLQVELPRYEKLREIRWKQVLRSVRKTGWGFGSLLLIALVAGTAITMVSKVSSWRQRFQATAGAQMYKHSIFEYVTGNYLAAQYCQVAWDWEDAETVGRTFTFSIQFFQRNGRPYPISNRDLVLVEISHGNASIPPTIQYGGKTDSEANRAQVAFTVHRAGDYRISVMVGARHIRGSPFHKRFKPGALDPSKTGFVGQSTVVVATRGLIQSLVLEPRDEYGNMCAHSPDSDSKSNYKLVLKQVGTSKQFTPRLHIAYENSTGRIVLNLLLEEVGCYTATAFYCDNPIRNNSFTLLVLSPDDSAAVKKAVAKKSHNLYYDARLLTGNYDNQQKPKKVYCYISPKQLTVKEFYLKVIPKRLFTFRVCPSTKFQFLGYNNQLDAPVFQIDDGCQPPVELASRDRNIIAATFTTFLLKNIGGSETFKDKQDFFYHEVRQIHHKRLHDKLTIKVNRANLLESSIKAVKNFSTSDWCKNFEIVFQGEEALDWGGVRREWFELLCTELFDPSRSGLFRRMQTDTQGLVHPNPFRAPHLKTKLYEVAGRIVGKCLYESALGGSYRQLVKAKFTRSFLALIIGLRVNYKYFEQDDPELYLTKIRYIEENDVNDMELSFSEEEYEGGALARVVELIPNGSKVAVTNSNKLRYLDALAQYKLANNVRDETDSFLKGLNELIPDNLLSIFDEYELELLMCGTGNYSIADLKDHHIVSGSTPQFFKTLEWFWAIVAGFTPEEMARLLQFVTGCSQLPPGGFGQLLPKFQFTAAPTYGNLPTAHTCFNQLCLPEYESMEQFHRMLIVAINEGNQGFGMI